MLCRLILLFMCNCVFRAFLTEITNKEAVDDDEFLTPVSHLIPGLEGKVARESYLFMRGYQYSYRINFSLTILNSVIQELVILENILCSGGLDT